MTSLRHPPISNAVLFVVLFTLIGLFSNNTNAEQQEIAPDQNVWSEFKMIRNYLSKNEFFKELNFENTEHFKNASLNEQLEIGKKAAKATLRHMSMKNALKNLAIRTAFFGIPTAVGAGLFYYVPMSREVVIFAASSFAVLAPFIIYGMGEQAYYAVSPAELPEQQMLVEYVSKRHLFSNSTRNFIEENMFYPFWQTESPMQYEKLVKVLDKALRLPLYKKELIYNPTMLAESFAGFSVQLQKRLQRFTLAELNYQKMKNRLDIHYPVYFQGLPGTGKTYSAQQIAKAMDTTFTTVSLDGASIEDIVGTSSDNQMGKPGRLLEALIANTESIYDLNFSNKVLLIDEFDRLLVNDDLTYRQQLSFFLKILDPNHRYFYSEYLKTNIKLPDTIILAGNVDLHGQSYTNPQLQALASRIDQIEFTGFSPETKLKLAIKKLVPKHERSYQSIDPSLNDFTLGDEGIKEIEAFVKTDSDPGLRSLEKYITLLFEERLYAQGLTNSLHKRQD